MSAFLAAVGIFVLATVTLGLARILADLCIAIATAAEISRSGGVLVYLIGGWTPALGVALRAALRYLIFALLGSVFYLVGAALLFGAYGTLDIPLLAERLGPDAITLTAAAILLGNLVALGQVRLKLLVAYSAVAQIGYLFLMFPLALRGAAALERGSALTAGLLQAVSSASATCSWRGPTTSVCNPWSAGTTRC
jgi:NADH:ubiquinone oxidoreductase subunit 2 (subunit N)